MQCEVLLFAQLGEAIGTRRLDLELPAGATVGDALAQLCRDHRAIAAAKGGLAVAVNEAYCTLDAPLIEGSTIALIPPVSGG